MKKLYIIITIAGIFSSCTIVSKFFKPKSFTYFYDGKYTGIDTMINIKGYYMNDSFDCPMSVTPKLMFYEDGVFCETIADDIINYLSSDGKYRAESWGSYFLVGDTIKGQTINKGPIDDIARTTTWEFKINSKNTITLLKRERDDHLQSPSRDLCLFTFHPLENRIDSTNWLLKKKWFWKKGYYPKK